MNRWIKLLLVLAVVSAAFFWGSTQATAHPRWGVAVVGASPCYGVAYYAPIPRRAYYAAPVLAAPVVPVYRPWVVPVAPVYAPAPVLYYGW